MAQLLEPHKLLSFALRQTRSIYTLGTSGSNTEGREVDRLADFDFKTLKFLTDIPFFTIFNKITVLLQ